ncbi:MAG: acid phosphatase, partial [Bacteroidota bacterium]|nr:acid phosphatase [Bacteroidota bacterium]
MKIKNILSAILVLLLSQSVTAQVFIKDSLSIPKLSYSLIRKEKALQFLVMGDWGRNGADHQKQVAEQMGKTASDIKAQFIISTGDNFYPSGVISEFDPSFRYSFEDIYTAFSLQWDW